MTRLILTADASAAGGLKAAGRADLVIPIELRLVQGPPRPDAELGAFLSQRRIQEPGTHWLDYCPPRPSKRLATTIPDFSCLRALRDVELWIESAPNAQLVLIWLLDYLHSHANAATNLVLCHVDASLDDANPKQSPNGNLLLSASRTIIWKSQIVRGRPIGATTQQAWFKLLNEDLSILPQPRRCVVEMLEELPGRATGLGASESGFWN